LLIFAFFPLALIAQPLAILAIGQFVIIIGISGAAQLTGRQTSSAKQ
jgi:hypothetical protein